jgi:hypothetical protein
MPTIMEGSFSYKREGRKVSKEEGRREERTEKIGDEERRG